jgi:hypothetical protein
VISVHCPLNPEQNTCSTKGLLTWWKKESSF